MAQRTSSNLLKQGAKSYPIIRTYKLITYGFSYVLN